MACDAGSAKRRLLRDVARIGSLTFQQRVCLGGTKDEYLLLDELIETTLSCLENEISHDILSKKWSVDEREELRRFLDRADRLFMSIDWRSADPSLNDIIHKDESMKELRSIANQCLSHMNCSFEVEELLVD